ncbi:MAG: iron-containing alcohol dehydrogenase [Lachnospiraceae bacterium]|nr:iron-containing alcohol dehydrogenase [Lachnospiraceae bacterium]
MMKQHFNPVRLVMGKHAIQALPQEILRYGKKCLLVAQDNCDAMIEIKNRIGELLEKGGVEYDVFSEIRPNPLISDIEKGIRTVKENHYDAVVAVGGGSVIDTGKILSVSNDYEIDWQMAFAKPLSLHNKNKLPLFTVPTTAGTGSHCTQAAVISDDHNRKHSVYSFDFFSTAAFVDYTLTMSLPKPLTASTGFDAFCHLSESYIMGRLSPIMEMMSLDAMRKIVRVLPKLMEENREEYREIMSIADSCAGICLSNGGAIVPHAFGEAISSHVYRINHGCSLAVCYPAFTEHFYNHKEYGKRIKDVAEILGGERTDIQDGKRARAVVEHFIESLELKYTLADYGVSEEELSKIRESFLEQKRFKPEEVTDIIEDICGETM